MQTMAYASISCEKNKACPVVDYAYQCFCWGQYPLAILGAYLRRKTNQTSRSKKTSASPVIKEIDLVKLLN